MARRDGTGVRLITRNGNDFTQRFSLAVAAVEDQTVHVADLAAYPNLG